MGHGGYMPDKSQIQKMFRTISPTYDLLNTLLSFHIDAWWRRRTVAIFRPQWRKSRKQLMLDLCSGTLDLSLQIAKNSQPQVNVLALDFCYEMLREGREKIPIDQQNRVWLVCADSECLPLRDNIATGAVVGFGLRNLIDRPKGLKEMNRTLKPGAKLAVLEFSQPKSRFFRALYYFYFLCILPRIGGLISGNARAYQYLPESVLKFYTPRELQEIMQKVGFQRVRFSLLTGGIAALHVGEKRYAGSGNC
jgi:demethylmenaquinone methyltransferase/2-methoxy-6-polyprenyl-1,4-benzoquinol methylase